MTRFGVFTDKHKGMAALQLALVEVWQKEHPHLRPSTARPCWQKIGGGHCDWRHYGSHECNRHDLFDHPEAWFDVVTKKMAMITAHPYHKYEDELAK